VRTATWTSRASAVLAVALAAGFASTSAVAAAAHTPAPRLVVLIVVDQFRYDLLTRYRDYLSKGGFARFLDEGARFTRARYLHATTETCPGHAVIGTGTWAADNGIIANRWFDAARETEVGCAAPDRQDLALLRPTIAEEIEHGSGGASISIVASEKDSAAQMLAGASADGVFWPNASGEFTTWRRSPPLPAWVERFNERELANPEVPEAWTRLLPKAVYDSFGPDDVQGEMGVDGRRSFPHVLDAGDGDRKRTQAAVLTSPYGDALLLRFALAALRNEPLGADSVTDYLALSFSASDRVGHRFGPDSQEHMDTTLRLDRALASLIDAIDARVGLDRTLLILTADHGVAPMPEVARTRAWGGGAQRLPRPVVADAVERALTSRYGAPPLGRWIAFEDFPNLYLDEKMIQSLGIDVNEATRAARDAVAAVPGVEQAWTRNRLMQLRETADAASVLERAALLSFRPGRSGDVVYTVSRYVVVAEIGSSHGSPWSYDGRVPLMWLGPGIAPGDYGRPVSPVDIAPTLYAFLGLRDPGTSGRVLSEMFVTQNGRGSAGR
jgi:predicted AlkP superfamily pyrophosphatase or phosphodiesterase